MLISLLLTTTPVHSAEDNRLPVISDASKTWWFPRKELGQSELTLTQSDMSPWIPRCGAWNVVKDAKQDSSNPKKLTIEEGVGVLVNGNAGRTLNLFSRTWHGDVKASIEFMVPKGSNSGIYFMGRYEIQIYDSHGKNRVGFGDCGGIYQRWDNGRGFEGRGARVNAAKPAGEWQRFEVDFRAPRFGPSGNKLSNARFAKVVLNGEVIHEHVEVTGPTRSPGFHHEGPMGPLMLQGDHGPVAYRNISLSGELISPSRPGQFDVPLRWHPLTEGKAPASTGGPDTGVFFKNTSKQTVKIYWVDYRGERKLYGELAPGGTRDQGTVD
ncbi:MAG: family 16 glycoside hydrolase, partial [Verrucomicrobiota bacterium]